MGHSQTSVGLGTVKPDQGFSPKLSLPRPQVKVVIVMGAPAGGVTRTKVNTRGKHGEKSQPKVAVGAANVP